MELSVAACLSLPLPHPTLFPTLGIPHRPTSSQKSFQRILDIDADIVVSYLLDLGADADTKPENEVSARRLPRLRSSSHHNTPTILPTLIHKHPCTYKETLYIAFKLNSTYTAYGLVGVLLR
jgi:hypothetical protein